MKEPQHVTTHYSHLELYGLSEGTFTSLLTCDFTFCGEVVAVSGNYSSREVEEPGGEDGDLISYTDRNFVPKAIVPAPPIITWPENLDKVPRSHLIKAFGLFWADSGSCANRLRIFVETFLDQLVIERKGKKRTGKTGDLDLSERIDLLEAAKPGHKRALDALRHVGNTGSHEGDVDFDDLLTCFELIEFTLTNLLEGRYEKLMAKADNINDRKGRPAG